MLRRLAGGEATEPFFSGLHLFLHDASRLALKSKVSYLDKYAQSRE